MADPVQKEAKIPAKAAPTTAPIKTTTTTVTAPTTTPAVPAEGVKAETIVKEVAPKAPVVPISLDHVRPSEVRPKESPDIPDSRYVAIGGAFAAGGITLYELVSQAVRDPDIAVVIAAGGVTYAIACAVRKIQIYCVAVTQKSSERRSSGSETDS